MYPYTPPSPPSRPTATPSPTNVPTAYFYNSSGGGVYSVIENWFSDRFHLSPLGHLPTVYGAAVIQSNCFIDSSIADVPFLISEDASISQATDCNLLSEVSISVVSGGVDLQFKQIGTVYTSSDSNVTVFCEQIYGIISYDSSICTMQAPTELTFVESQDYSQIILGNTPVYIAHSFGDSAIQTGLYITTLIAQDNSFIHQDSNPDNQPSSAYFLDSSHCTGFNGGILQFFNTSLCSSATASNVVFCDGSINSDFLIQTGLNPVIFSGYSQNNSFVIGDAIFYSGSYNNGTITGNARFGVIEPSTVSLVDWIEFTGVVLRNVYDSGGNLFEAKISYVNSAPYGSISVSGTGSVNFYGSIVNQQTIHSPSITFNDTSSNGSYGIVFGGANSNSTNYLSNCTVFKDYSVNLG